MYLCQKMCEVVLQLYFKPKLQSDPVLCSAHPTAQAECCSRVWVWHLEQTLPGSWAAVVPLRGVVVAPAAHVCGTPAEPGRHLAAVPEQQHDTPVEALPHHRQDTQQVQSCTGTSEQHIVEAA